MSETAIEIPDLPEPDPVEPTPVPEFPPVPSLEEQLAELPELPPILNPKADRYRKGIPPVFEESKEKYMQGELTKLERVSDLAYDDVIKVTKDGSVLRANIEREQIVRVTNDYALAKTIETLTANVKTDREQTQATIQNVQTVFATRDEALAQTIRTLDSKVETEDKKINATIVEERTAWTTKTNAIAQSVDTLETKVNTNDSETKALISSERTAWSNADNALGRRIDTTNAAVGENKADISSEITARATADTALGGRIDRLTTTVGQNTAAISSEATARANGDTANANLISSVSTTVSGVQTTVSQQATSINGLLGKWGVSIKSGNRFAGFSLNSGANSVSSFDVEANNFNIFDPNTGEKKVYWNGSELVVKGDITANRITASAFIGLPESTIPRPTVSNPQVSTQGTFSCYESAGFTGENVDDPYNSFTVFIPTGIRVSSSYTLSQSKQYLASAKIASADVTNHVGPGGYSEVQILVGDGAGSYAGVTNNEIYLRFTWHPSKQDSSQMLVKSIRWKVVEV